MYRLQCHPDFFVHTVLFKIGLDRVHDIVNDVPVDTGLYCVSYAKERRKRGAQSSYSKVRCRLLCRRTTILFDLAESACMRFVNA